MKAPRAYDWLALGGILVLGAAILPVAGADVVRQHEVLSHAAVILTITPFGHDGQNTARPPGPSEQPHRLAVVLRDTKTAAAIADAHVHVNVAEKGFAGVDYALNRAPVDGVPGYVAYAVMPGRAAYRVLVHVMLPRVQRVLEAQFEYRHHH